MTHITEHYAEEERESRNCDYCWVSLLILWNTVGINDLLKSRGELVGLHVCGPRDIVVLVSYDAHSWELADLIHDVRFLVLWGPEIADKCSILHLHHVQG